jgi:hypothetical protein
MARKGKAMAREGFEARRGKAISPKPIKEATFPLQIIPPSGIKRRHGSSDDRIRTDYLSS